MVHVLNMTVSNASRRMLAVQTCQNACTSNMRALSSDNLGGRHVSNLITLVMLGVELVSLNRSEKMNGQTGCASARVLRVRCNKTSFTERCQRVKSNYLHSSFMTVLTN